MVGAVELLSVLEKYPVTKEILEVSDESKMNGAEILIL